MHKFGHRYAQVVVGVPGGTRGASGHDPVVDGHGQYLVDGVVGRLVAGRIGRVGQLAQRREGYLLPDRGHALDLVGGADQRGEDPLGDGPLDGR